MLLLGVSSLTLGDLLFISTCFTLNIICDHVCDCIYVILYLTSGQAMGRGTQRISSGFDKQADMKSFSIGK